MNKPKEEKLMKKKIFVIVLAIVMIVSISAGVMAATGNSDTLGKGRNAEEELTRQEKIARAHRRMMYMFNEYYPEGVEGLLEVWEDHREFHEGAWENRQAIIEAMKEDREEIKALYESGEIDRAEARRLIAELRGNITAMRTEFSDVTEEKQAAQQLVRDRLEEVREEIKGLLDSEEVDAEAIQELLVETLELLNQHVENDVLFHTQYLEIAAYYGY